MSGIEKFMDSFGLPLDFILYELKTENCLVDWVDFIEFSISNNWKISQTLSKIEEAVTEVYGKKYSVEIIKRLRFYLKLPL